eukprot:m.20423 g.20423  ORF g.20423 m.20423 type:complete len:135 (-) comp12935_c0_seq1:217-621(-)
MSTGTSPEMSIQHNITEPNVVGADSMADAPAPMSKREAKRELKRKRWRENKERQQAERLAKLGLQTNALEITTKRETHKRTKKKQLKRARNMDFFRTTPAVACVHVAFDLGCHRSKSLSCLTSLDTKKPCHQVS